MKSKSKNLKIVQFGNPVLREPAKRVTVFHSKIHALIDSMSATLDKREDGAALAANQVDVLKRISVIDYVGEYIEMVNPEILEMSGEQSDLEGCLSYTGYFGTVKRADYVKVKYQDRYGKENIIERRGKLARAIQHEVDHLNGILFIDRVDEEFLIHSHNETKILLEEVKKIAGYG